MLNSLHHTFFWKKLLFIDLKLGHILSNLKTFKKASKLFEYNVTFFPEVIIYQHFPQET